jgi:hypothetical protein
MRVVSSADAAAPDTTRTVGYAVVQV